MPKISIFVPDEEPIVLELEGSEIGIGRAADNDIPVGHDSISGHHAQLRLDGEQWVLVDLGSTNGTFVDGAPAENVNLTSGAQIVFGQVPATFEDENAPAPEVPAASEPAGGEAAAGFSSSISAQAADSSNRPAEFKNLSPIERVEKKSLVGQIAMLSGVIAIVAAVAAIAMTFMMKSPS